jgi:hypothetical protein
VNELVIRAGTRPARVAVDAGGDGLTFEAT